MDLKIKVI